MSDPLLSVENLRVDFGVGASAAHAVRGVSFKIDRGETLGIVGESGSGKSVTALSILRLISTPGRIAGGRILFDGVDLLKTPEKRLRDLRGSRIAMVFQDPLTSLNPTLTVGDQIVETILQHRGSRSVAAKSAADRSVTKREAWAEAEALLRQVHMTLPERRVRQYPFELSGGMRQRAMIAMAFSCRPELLIADEPTTALDVTVQAQILDLMDELRRDHGTSVLLITHDLGIVAERCDNVAVMYAGEIVEYAAARDLFSSPKHPYTQALLASLPDWRRPRTEAPLPALPGQPPSLTASSIDGTDVDKCCPFAPRCPQVMDACRTSNPPPVVVDQSGRYARCLRVDGSPLPDDGR